MVCSQYLASAEDKKLIAILKKELNKKAERLFHMNIIVKEIIAKNRLTLQTVILKTKIMCFLSCIEQIYCFRSEQMTLCFLFI